MHADDTEQVDPTIAPAFTDNEVPKQADPINDNELANITAFLREEEPPFIIEAVTLTVEPKTDLEAMDTSDPTTKLRSTDTLPLISSDEVRKIEPLALIPFPPTNFPAI